MFTKRTSLIALAALLLPAISSAQSLPADTSRPPGPPPRAPIENLDPVKKQIAATDEEWKVIGPQLRKVIAARRAIEPTIDLGAPNNGPPRNFRGPNPGRDSFAGPGGGGPPGPPPPPPNGQDPPPNRPAGSQPATQPARGGGPNMQQSPITQAQAELQSTLADKNSSPDQIKEKVAQVRAAKQKARDTLTAAQKDLTDLLTPDQQTILISLGYLD